MLYFRMPHAQHSRAMIEKITPHYRDFYNRVTSLGGGVRTHDPSTFACILRPELEERKEVNICVDVDAEGVLALVHERLTANR